MASKWTEIPDAPGKADPKRAERKKSDKKKSKDDAAAAKKRRPKKTGADGDHKLKLLEEMVILMSKMLTGYERDIAVLLAQSTMMTFVGPATAVPLMAGKQKYHNYFDWVAERKAAGAEKHEIPPPDGPVLTALLRLAQQALSGPQQKAVGEAVVRLQTLEGPDLQEYVQVCRTSKAFSTKGQPKRNKLRVMLSLEAHQFLGPSLRAYLCGAGLEYKAGVAPRSGAVRELCHCLEFLAGAQKEEEDDE